jgi:hypothetical protein
MRIHFNFTNIEGAFYITPYIEYSHWCKMFIIGWFNLCLQISFEKNKVMYK